ncbi:hypothetical protein EDB85DRAFT_1898418 [Lactarius pseudohatsudake]|nr:hypothetical protein EDB85DRAFT_1898418 [Lactarius pseudohatsudake]
MSKPSSSVKPAVGPTNHGRRPAGGVTSWLLVSTRLAPKLHDCMFLLTSRTATLKDGWSMVRTMVESSGFGIWMHIVRSSVVVDSWPHLDDNTSLVAREPQDSSDAWFAVQPPARLVKKRTDAKLQSTSYCKLHCSGIPPCRPTAVPTIAHRSQQLYSTSRCFDHWQAYLNNVIAWLRSSQVPIQVVAVNPGSKSSPPRDVIHETSLPTRHHLDQDHNTVQDESLTWGHQRAKPQLKPIHNALTRPPLAYGERGTPGCVTGSRGSDNPMYRSRSEYT